ncbi:Arc family DNA-binding protein [Paracoccus sp. SY]|uniref:Arc family DNA-binding protein n=1 Tax=Paracoccus sp. SY TaxID=1330255 RepID=UPI000CD0765E|nr:Arc family DNA-binding protein [Paracoccus sp. SY]
MAAPTTRESDKFIVRLPDGMRDRIKAAAEANNRSMNAEIIATLESAYPAPHAMNVFERGVEAFFLDFGWSVESGMDIQRQGIDMIAFKGPIAVSVDCKMSLSQLTVEHVERVSRAKKRFGSNAGVIVGAGEVTDEKVVASAKELKVLILDIDKSPAFPALLERLKPFAEDTFLEPDEQ